MKNKLLAGILSAAMVLTMGAVPVMADTASDAAASVGSTNYSTIQAAIDAVADGTDTTVVLQADTTESVTIPAGKSIVLDLNGHKITNKSENTIVNNGTLKITGTGTVDNVSHQKAALVNCGTAVLDGGSFTRSMEAGKNSKDSGGNSYYTIENKGDMTINSGVTVTTNSVAGGGFSSLVENIGEKNSDLKGKLTINGGNFSGGLNAVKNDDYGTLYITGGDFKNKSNVVIMNWNDAVISGGTFVSENEHGAVIFNGHYQDVDKGKLKITGGTFKAAEGTNALYNSPDYKGGVISVSGGNFSVAVPSEFCADGFNPVTTTDADGHTVYTVDNYVKPPAPTMYKVTAGSTENGTLNVGVTSEAEGCNVAIDPVPAEGYELDTVTVTDSNGKSIEVTKTEENEYIFKMPSSDVTVNAAFKKAEDHSANCPSKAFTDVDTAQFYHNAVDWAVTKKVTSGTSATTFSPETTCTRAELVTFIWRAAGSPAAAASLDFTDVAKSDYCYNAVQWAVEHNITVGTGENKFSPGETVDRSQVVTFLYRYAGSPDVTGSSQFSDVKDTDFFANAVQWAVANSITSGTSATEFAPARSCTRAEAVTLLYNYFSK